MIRHGEDKQGNRLTPEQVEDAKRRKAELEGQLEELRRRLERLKRGRITAWLPREAPRPAPSARPAEGRAPQPSPQPTPPTASQPAPKEERRRLWELFSATLAAAGIDPTQFREEFEVEYGRVANRPYEEKLSDIMRFTSDIVRTYRPRLARPAAAPADLHRTLQSLRETIARQVEETLRKELESLAKSLAAPPRPGEYLTAAEAELATVRPDRAVIHTYVREHNCWAWVPNKHAVGLMRRFGLHHLIISRFMDCVEYWPSYPGACLWGTRLVDKMVEQGLITDPFAAWLRALAAEIDRRYQEEGRAPCR